MKIAVVGAGAIGSYYGARLVAAGHEVKFLLRSDYDHVSRYGLRVESVHGDIDLPNISAYQTSEEIGEVGLVIVAWKTTSNQFAREVLSPLIGPETKILTLQNGLGNAEFYGELFGIERVIGGLCFVCINRLKPGLISHTASGLIRLASAQPGNNDFVEDLVSQFKQANIRCESVGSLEKALWMKLVWNFPFNGLAIAEGGVDTEVLLKERKLESLVRLIMREVIDVGRALGHDISYDMIDQQIAITLPMGAYRPSSMIDFVEGRQVEYDAIWNMPIQVAEDIGIKVPEMKKLALRVKLQLGF